jgi:hypothetical protein
MTWGAHSDTTVHGRGYEALLAVCGLYGLKHFPDVVGLHSHKEPTTTSGTTRSRGYSHAPGMPWHALSVMCCLKPTLAPASR